MQAFAANQQIPAGSVTSEKVMRVFIIGAAGAIGKCLTEVLLKNGMEVVWMFFKGTIFRHLTYITRHKYCFSMPRKAIAKIMYFYFTLSFFRS